MPLASTRAAPFEVCAVLAGAVACANASEPKAVVMTMAAANLSEVFMHVLPVKSETRTLHRDKLRPLPVYSAGLFHGFVRHRVAPVPSPRGRVGRFVAAGDSSQRTARFGAEVGVNRDLVEGRLRQHAREIYHARRSRQRLIGEALVLEGHLGAFE